MKRRLAWLVNIDTPEGNEVIIVEAADWPKLKLWADAHNWPRKRILLLK